MVSTTHSVIPFDVYQCTRCGLMCQYPMPTEAQLKRFYQEIYNKKHNLTLAEKAFEEMDSKQEQGRIKAIEKYVNGGRLLDVGASTGFSMLEIMKRKQWQVWGVEYAKNAVNEAKLKYGLNIIWGDIFSAKLPTNFMMSSLCIRFLNIYQILWER